MNYKDQQNMNMQMNMHEFERMSIYCAVFIYDNLYAAGSMPYIYRIENPR